MLAVAVATPVIDVWLVATPVMVTDPARGGQARVTGSSPSIGNRTTRPRMIGSSRERCRR